VIILLFISVSFPSSLRYLHLDEGILCRVRRLAWCNDPESYAGGSVATGRATLAWCNDPESYAGGSVATGRATLAWYNDPESYAGGSVATGRATLARQVKGEHPDKERYTGPPGWGLGQWASSLSFI